MTFNHTTNTHSTTCEECGTRLTLTTIDDTFIGDECPGCLNYITRYLPGMEPL